MSVKVSDKLQHEVDQLVRQAAESLVADAGINPASPDEVRQFVVEAKLPWDLSDPSRAEWDSLTREQRDKLIDKSVGDKDWVL